MIFWKSAQVRQWKFWGLAPYLWWALSMLTGPSRATRGHGKTILAGPYHNPIPWALGSRRQKEGDIMMRRGVPLRFRLGGLWSVVSSPSGVWGSNRKLILCIGLLEVRKKPSGTPFSVFLSDGGARKRRGARKTYSLHPPLPSLSTGMYADENDEWMKNRKC